MTCRPLLRTLRFVALLIQLALPSLGMVADAHLDHGAVEALAHVESDTHPCAEQGHPELCALCQYLRSAVVAPKSGEPPETRTPAWTPTTLPSRIAGAPLTLPTLPRGPPRFS